jgi:RND family efflux transporter MFP subunit
MGTSEEVDTMNCPILIKRGAAMAALVALLGFVGADDASRTQITMVQGISIPSAKHNLSFFDTGIVKEILVQPGDAVKVGQVLAKEDTDLEEIQLKAMQVETTSTSEVDAAIKDRDSKKIIRDNMQQAFDANGANKSELQEAILAYETAEIKITYATEQHDEKVLEAAKQEKKIAKMQLISPVDGIVEKINLQPGEVVDPNKPEGAITVVKNSPIWVDMHLPSALASKLKLNDSLQVAYANDADTWLTGSIIYFEPVVDAASDTQTVRVQLDNKEGKPSGLQLNIRLPFVGDKAGQTALGR